MISGQEGYNKLKTNRQTNKKQHSPDQTNGKRPAITENLEMSDCWRKSKQPFTLYLKTQDVSEKIGRQKI